MTIRVSQVILYQLLCSYGEWPECSAVYALSVLFAVLLILLHIASISLPGWQYTLTLWCPQNPVFILISYSLHCQFQFSLLHIYHRRQSNTEGYAQCMSLAYFIMLKRAEEWHCHGRFKRKNTGRIQLAYIWPSVMQPHLKESLFVCKGGAQKPVK